MQRELRSTASLHCMHSIEKSIFTGRSGQVIRDERRSSNKETHQQAERNPAQELTPTKEEKNDAANQDKRKDQHMAPEAETGGQSPAPISQQALPAITHRSVRGGRESQPGSEQQQEGTGQPCFGNAADRDQLAHEHRIRAKSKQDQGQQGQFFCIE